MGGDEISDELRSERCSSSCILSGTAWCTSIAKNTSYNARSGMKLYRQAAASIHECLAKYPALLRFNNDCRACKQGPANEGTAADFAGASTSRF